jgi:oligopeptidase B
MPFSTRRAPRAALLCSLAALAAALPAAAWAQSAAPAARPPVARVVPRVDTVSGDVVVDNYAWLRDKTDPAVIAHLTAENAYADAATAHTAPVRDSLYREILGRVKETDASPPYLDGGYWYYSRTEAGKSYPIFCRRKGSLTAPEEVVLDQNLLAAGKKYHGLGGMDVSPDGGTMLYLEDTTAFRDYTLYVKDLRSGPPRGLGARRVERHRVGRRQPHLLLHDRRLRQAGERGLAAHRGRAARRRRERVPRGLAPVQRGRLALAVGQVRAHRRVELHHLGVARRAHRAARGQAGGGRAAPRGGGVRRRARGRRLPHPHQRRRAQLQGRARPRVRPVAAQLARLAPAPPDAFVEFVDPFRGFVVVGERTGGMRRLRVTELDGGRAHTVALPRGRVRGVPVGERGVRHAVVPRHLLVARHAEHRVRLRRARAAARPAQAHRGAHLRRVALRGAAR